MNAQDKIPDDDKIIAIRAEYSKNIQRLMAAQEIEKRLLEAQENISSDEEWYLKIEIQGTVPIFITFVFILQDMIHN